MTSDAREICRHTFIKVTKTTYDILTPYHRCAKCGAVRAELERQEQPK